MWLIPLTVYITLLLTTGLVTSTHPDIEVSPSDVNRTLFEEGSFRRTCRYTGSQEVSELQIIHDEDVIERESGGTTSIMLDVMTAQLSDAGSYTCRIVFSDSTSITANLGALTVVDLDLITAPPEQYVVAGEDISLQCSFRDPDHLYGVVITTIRRGSQTTQTITDASVDDEGSYQCDVSLVTHTDSTLVPIFLHIFTPINITDSPVNHQELFGVRERNFSVTFTGRESQNIAVRWYRQGVALQSTPRQQITTTFSEEEMSGRTTIHFPEMRRSDSGVYRVVVSTDFAEDEFVLQLRRQSLSFQVEIRVPPPNPTNFEAAVVAEHHVELQWTLPISHPDEDVESFQLEVTYPNGSTASMMMLDSSARSAVVAVFPGVSYEAHLLARNTDGLGESRLSFSTPPAAPYVLSFESRRLNETHFNISVSLLYTGGGDTTTFSVYFRELNSVEWSEEPIMTVELDSVLALEYHGIISGEAIRGKGPLEFELRVVNGFRLMNRTGSGEISDPPGVPTKPMVSEKSDTSVTLNFKLPEEGTPPFINIVLEFSKPPIMARNFTGTYSPGQTVIKEVRDLSPQTEYTLKARAVNYAGNGPSSEIIRFTTDEARPTTATTTSSTPDPGPMSSMPWLLPALCGGVGAVVLVVGAVIIGCICYCCCHRRNKKANSYTVAKTPETKDIERGGPDANMHHTIGMPPATLSSLDKPTRPMAASNPYITVPQHDHMDRPPSTASSTPSNHKWPLDKSNNQVSSSTLNSGGSATQDSLIKKQDIYSTTGSDIQLGSLQSSQQGLLSSHSTSRDSLPYYKRHHHNKVMNPSISSGGSEATSDTAERYQTTSFLPPQVEETFSFQTMPFIPEGSSFSSLTCSVDQPSQCVSDV